MQPPCSTRGPTFTLRPFHSRRLGLLGLEEPEISSIIAPSAKLSPVLRKVSVPFDALLALIFSLVFKSPPVAGRFPHKTETARPIGRAEHTTTRGTSSAFSSNSTRNAKFRPRTFPAQQNLKFQKNNRYFRGREPRSDNRLCNVGSQRKKARY